MAIHRSFKKFSERMRTIAGNVVTNSNEIKKRAALVLDRDLVLATPVDTGRARSNWIVSLESPDDSVKDPYAPGSKLGTGEAANAQAALLHAESIISTAIPGQSIYVANNVPYAGALNDGSSAQAPAGFVEEAMIRTNRYIRKQSLLRKP